MNDLLTKKTEITELSTAVIAAIIGKTFTDKRLTTGDQRKMYVYVNI